MKKINLTIKQINDTVNELTKSNTIIFISGKTIKGQFNTSISFKTYFNNKNGFKTEILNTRSCNIIWDKLIKMGYE